MTPCHDTDSAERNSSTWNWLSIVLRVNELGRGKSVYEGVSDIDGKKAAEASRRSGSSVAGPSMTNSLTRNVTTAGDGTESER
jgi:hypothetical protein